MTDTIQFRRLVEFYCDVKHYAMATDDDVLLEVAEACHEDLLRVGGASE